MKKFLIIIDGPMGSGKTTISELLQKRIKEKTALISLDKIKRLVSQYKLDSKPHIKLAHKLGALMANFYLKNKINVIIEKAFTKGQFLSSFINLIEEKPRIFVYQAEAPFEVRLSRIKEREAKKEKGIPRDKLLEKVTRNNTHYEKFKYKRAIIFDTSKLSLREVVNKMLKDIK